MLESTLKNCYDSKWVGISGKERVNTYVVRGDRQTDPSESVRNVREDDIGQVYAEAGDPRPRINQVRGVLATKEEVAPRYGRGESPKQALAATAARSEGIVDKLYLQEIVVARIQFPLERKSR